MTKPSVGKVPIPEKSRLRYKFSYISEHDGFVKRTMIDAVERLTGRQFAQQMYREIEKENPTPWNVWGKALAKLDISLNFDETQLAKVPQTGPVIFIANHPFGIVDGIIFCHLASKVRKDYFLLVNEVVADEPLVEGHLLPVDFRPTKEAMSINLQTRKETAERLDRGEALVIFPGGGVATAWNIFGELEEFPWKTFICPRIHKTRATIIPMYFHGRNSMIFHMASKISMDLRLGFLLHEVMNKRGKTIKVEIGDPITYDQMASLRNRQVLIDFLYEKTMELKDV